MCSTAAQFQNPINLVMRNCMITDYDSVRKWIRDGKVKFDGVLVNLYKQYCSPNKISIDGVSSVYDGEYGIINYKYYYK